MIDPGFILFFFFFRLIIHCINIGIGTCSCYWCVCWRLVCSFNRWEWWYHREWWWYSKSTIHITLCILLIKPVQLVNQLSLLWTFINCCTENKYDDWFDVVLSKGLIRRFSLFEHINCINQNRNKGCPLLHHLILWWIIYPSLVLIFESPVEVILCLLFI